ncbi:glutamate synthase-related protein [Streptomyces sp. NBC_01356]|uniref:glutamate synthase-related protein n=1 Tax=Streptomyces sp. NBC_01356 TaxID=2903836 RepID=UPI003FCDD540
MSVLPSQRHSTDAPQGPRRCGTHPALEIKLGQGARLGCVQPAPKASRDIADTCGVPEGVDCLSSSRHAEFDDVDSMLQRRILWSPPKVRRSILRPLRRVTRPPWPSGLLCPQVNPRSLLRRRGGYRPPPDANQNPDS